MGLASQLDTVPGIGPARRKSLLKHFGSIDKIREASMDELTTVVPKNVAESIKAHLD
jgi:excinuclease ABC subunit C